MSSVKTELKSTKEAVTSYSMRIPSIYNLICKSNKKLKYINHVNPLICQLAIASRGGNSCWEQYNYQQPSPPLVKTD